MSVNCVWELQKAIYAVLDGDSILSNLVTGIFDHVPQDTEYPYVTIGEMRAIDYSTKTTSGAEVDITVNTFARDKGSKSNIDIMSRIYNLLHDSNLTLTTCSLINMRFVSNEVISRQDGLTYQGIQRFRAVIQV